MAGLFYSTFSQKSSPQAGHRGRASASLSRMIVLPQSVHLYVPLPGLSPVLYIDFTSLQLIQYIKNQVSSSMAGIDFNIKKPSRILAVNQQKRTLQGKASPGSGIII